MAFCRIALLVPITLFFVSFFVITSADPASITSDSPISTSSKQQQGKLESIRPYGMIASRTTTAATPTALSTSRRALSRSSIQRNAWSYNIRNSGSNRSSASDTKSAGVRALSFLNPALAPLPAEVLFLTVPREASQLHVGSCQGRQTAQKQQQRIKGPATGTSSTLLADRLRCRCGNSESRNGESYGCGTLFATRKRDCEHTAMEGNNGLVCSSLSGKCDRHTKYRVYFFTDCILSQTRSASCTQRRSLYCHGLTVFNSRGVRASKLLIVQGYESFQHQSRNCTPTRIAGRQGADLLAHVLSEIFSTSPVSRWHMSNFYVHSQSVATTTAIIFDKCLQLKIKKNTSSSLLLQVQSHAGPYGTAVLEEFISSKIR